MTNRIEEDVCYSAKIGILKQITTQGLCNADRRHDVCYSAKIGILKQITTYRFAAYQKILMFVTLQR